MITGADGAGSVGYHRACAAAWQKQASSDCAPGRYSGERWSGRAERTALAARKDPQALT
jgi:hypothetical protein